MSNILGFLQAAWPFLFVLGVLIFVHELGHFLVARWYGVRVLAFSLGFGPKLIKVTRGGTEYCVSLVPLGGYVKLAGETVEDKPSGEPGEFLSKSKWVRFQVYLAGPVMNLMLAVLLTTVVLSQGADLPIYETSPPVIGRVVGGSAGERAGLKAGDRILRVNAEGVATWNDLDFAIGTKAGRELSLSVRRGESVIDVRVTPDSVGRFEIGTLGIWPVLRPQVAMVRAKSPAERAGFQRGDVVLALGGERGLDRQAVIDRIQKNRQAPLVITVERAGRALEIRVVPDLVGEVGQVGLDLTGGEMRRIDPGVVGAARMSVQKNWDDAKMIGKIMKGLFTAETPVKQLLGPVAIAEMSGGAAELGWIPLFSFMAMISLNLGLLNLMPIPVLDGGHIAILGLEGLARRDFSVRVKERILFAGFALILMLMVTVIYNDVARLLR